MTEHERRGDQISANISGPVSGQVGVGKGISQSQTSGAAPPVTEDELQELRSQFAALKAQVETEAPDDRKAAALERVQELEEAVINEEPDITTMEYVRGWFSKNLPKLAGAVTSVVVHPIVGRIVESTGDMAAAEFQRRFGPGSRSR